MLFPILRIHLVHNGSFVTFIVPHMEALLHKNPTGLFFFFCPLLIVHIEFGRKLNQNGIERYCNNFNKLTYRRMHACTHAYKYIYVRIIVFSQVTVCAQEYS